MRLSYLHNLGDVYVSLAPVVAGLLVLFTGYAVLDPLVALVVAIWFIATTSREVIGSRDELIWPERLVCDHPSNVGTP
jgi:cobalt-zinc-cadmium efflux system protein